MLTPGQLELLHRIGQHRSLTAAAHEAGLTPPAVTQQLARLERSVGAPVVDRGPRGATLTELGALLAAEGELIKHSVQRADDIVRAHLGLAARRLRVGALASTIRPLVADALTHVRVRLPQAELSVVEIGSDDGIAAVCDAELDIAVVADYGGLELPDTVTGHDLIEDPLLLVVPDSHPVATARGPVDLSRLADDEWVSGAPGRRHRVQQDDVAARFDLDLRVTYETESYEVSLALVAIGTAVALIPRTAWHPTSGVTALRVRGTPARRLLAVTPSRAQHLALLGPMVSALQQAGQESR